MVELTRVKGKNRGDIVLYALSTCVWCRKTKGLLDEMGVEYDYIYVDLLSKDDNAQIKTEIKKWNPACSFPTIIVNKTSCIVGFDKDKILEELG
jgi:glutaredoxin-like protein NrdH